MRGLRSCIAGIVMTLAMFGCGDDSQTRTSDIARVERDRPQIAFFRASGNGVYDLGMADHRGHNLEVLTGESIRGTVWPALFTDLSWSPDGKRIAFAGGTGPQTDEHDEPKDLYVIGPDDSEAERVTDLGDVGAPLWSPDGERLVFTRTSVEDGRPLRAELWSVRPDGSGLAQLTERGKSEADTAGSFSPDGSRLAVTRSVFDLESGTGTTAVYVMNADGSEEMKLIDNAAQPVFSPDGNRIAFSTDRDRNGELCYGDQCSVAGELYVANADGREPQRLTKTKAVNEDSPFWFPGGSRIAYHRGEVVDNAQGTGIFEMNADGSCVREILADPRLHTWYANPAVRPGSAHDGVGPMRC
jgi:Tol biopolymer transport system component